jgi:hypothetical protein
MHCLTLSNSRKILRLEMRRFISGRELNRLYYQEAVAPIISADFPNLRYAAALIGPGSDVLGYDSERSVDHGWGPRLLLFLADDAHHSVAESISERLSARLPASFRGFSTSFAKPDSNGVRWMEPSETGRVAHLVEIHSIREFVHGMLNIDLTKPLKNVDWLLMPQEQLLEVTGGEVYRDDLGELTRLRTTISWYPRDIWLLLMAAQWKRIAQEEPFVGRCGEAGDELGSRIVSGRLARFGSPLLPCRAALRALQQVAWHRVFATELRPTTKQPFAGCSLRRFVA